VASKRDNDPVNYGDFMEFKVAVERRLTALEERQNSMKEDIISLKDSIKELEGKMEESNERLISKIDELKTSFQNMMQSIQNKTQQTLSSRWKETLTLVGSIVGSVLLATYLGWLLRVVIGA